MNTSQNTQTKWNKRADSWENKRQSGNGSSHRIDSVISYIKNRELLSPASVIADVGSGPCRFAAEFAKLCKRVDCFDISDKMLKYGKEYADANNIHNIDYICCDFNELNIEESRYKEAYDLVFSSLTPAAGSADSVLKMTSMSRAYCLNISHIYKLNSIEEDIRKNLFPGLSVSKAFDRNFLNTFSFLFQNGYYPVADYDYRNEFKSFVPDRYYAEIISEHILPANLQNTENVELIWKYLEKQLDKNGMVSETTKSCYGRILWDTRLKTSRSDALSKNTITY